MPHDDTSPPDDFPGLGGMPEPAPPRGAPWEQRAFAGGGMPAGSPDEAAEGHFPDRLCAPLGRRDLETAIADQAGLAHYAVPGNYQPPKGNGALTLGDNAEIWQRFRDEDLYDTRRLTLEQMHLFPWFPLSPGRYHTPEAAFHRQEALAEMFRTPDGRAYFTPGGKASMIEGGVGAVRLRPRRLVSDMLYYFMTASSTATCHDGFPVLVPRPLYAQVAARLHAEGAVPVHLHGEMRYLPDDLPDFFDRKRTLPRLVLYADKLEILPAPRREVTRFLVTAAVAFLGTVNGQPGPYMTYASFDPARRESLACAVAWLQDFYVGGQYAGRIITDFDEVQPRFPDAVFGLADVMAGRLQADAVRGFLASQGLMPERTRPYFVTYKTVTVAAGGVYVEGNVQNSTIITGDGNTVGQ